MSVRLPRLLDANLNEIGRLRPSRLQADIKMTPLSRATMSLPGGEPDVPMRAFVEIYNGQGSLGVYRVSSCVPDYGKGQTIGLKHGLTVLADALTGGEETLSGSARKVIGDLLARQTQKIGGTPFWSLGRVDVPDSVSVSVPGERANVLQTLLDILKLPGINGRYMYAFDQSAFPWVLHVTALTDEDASEARLGRNLMAVSPTVDDSELVTRVYAEGLTNGYMDAASPFGVVAAKLDIPEGVDAAEYAREYLNEHKEPRAQIRLDAQELFRLTGDPLDRFYPGRMCRVPLPAYDATLHFRVVALTYEDLMSDPESVTVEMSNAKDDTSYRLASQSSRISANAGGISRNAGSISRQGVDLRKTQEDLVELDGSVATRFHDVGVTLNEQDAKLNLFASETIETIDGLSRRVSSAEIELDGVNAEIELKVSKDGVISSINQTSESVTINASRVNLNGYVTASQLEAEFAQFEGTITDTLYVKALSANGFECQKMTYKTNTISLGSMKVVTGVSGKETGSIAVRDANGNIIGSALTGYRVSVSTDTIYYLNWE